MMNAPAHDGRAGSFANLEEEAVLRHQISTTDPQKRAATLLLHTSDVARKLCMTVGKDVVGNIDGVMQILEIPRGRFAPDPIDIILQDMVKFTYFKRTDQNMDSTLTKFAKLSQKAEAGMLMGSGLPDECVPALCMQNAALAKDE